MGYYTRFSIEIKTAITQAKAKEIAAAINRAVLSKDVDEEYWFFTLDDYESANVENDEKATWDIMPADELKWYDWEDDMKAIAKEYPAIEFRVEGSGEERDDRWVALLKGDRYQIKYIEPPIDEWED